MSILHKVILVIINLSNTGYGIVSYNQNVTSDKITLQLEFDKIIK